LDECRAGHDRGRLVPWQHATRRAASCRRGCLGHRGPATAGPGGGRQDGRIQRTSQGSGRPSGGLDQVAAERNDRPRQTL